MKRYKNKMLIPKAIIFDLDGTLIHSAPDLHAAANGMLRTLERDPLSLPTIISFIGNGVEKLVERCLDATGGFDAPLRQEAIDFFLAFYTKNMTTLTRPYSGVVSALQAFRDAGIQLGICTNKPTEPAQEICEQLDLARFFKVIAGAEVGHPKKPDPAPLLGCLKALDVLPSQAIYVGDSTIDFFTARNAAIPFRLFSKGYLNAPLPDLSETGSFADWKTHGILSK